MIKEASNHRVYSIDECVVFAKTDEHFGGLSNMAPGYPLYVNDNVIPSAEALYQSLRYPLFPNIQFEIIAQTSPMTAKMISKKNYPFSRQDWDEIRTKVMRWCLEVKLSQHWNKFSALLKETGNKPIVEYSRKDTIWGATKISDKQLGGTNALGRLLMELREKYVHNGGKLVCVEPLDITGCLLFGYPIETVCNEEFYVNNPDFQAVEFLDLK
jgi:ribA/ribD-fused uncharacterized protein